MDLLDEGAEALFRLCLLTEPGMDSCERSEFDTKALKQLHPSIIVSLLKKKNEKKNGAVIH